MIRPKRLQAGMTIGFVSPVGLGHTSLRLLEELCKARGYGLVLADSCRAEAGCLGSPQEQASELNTLFRDDLVDAVVVLQGGYKNLEYLDYLDYEGIGQSAKPLVGNGECTPLHMAIQGKSHMITYYGPMGIDWLKAYDAELAGGEALQASYRQDLDQLFFTLEGRLRVIEPLPEPPRGTIGTALGEGLLLGGQMAFVSRLLGTSFDWGAFDISDLILFLDGGGESPEALEHMLQDLRTQGILQEIKGLALGSTSICVGDVYDLGYQALRYMEEQRGERASAPFICYVPIGLGAPNRTLPLGGRVSFRYISNTLVLFPYCQ